MKDPRDSRTLEIEVFPIPGRPGRPRQHADNAARQAAYRARRGLSPVANSAQGTTELIEAWRAENSRLLDQLAALDLERAQWRRTFEQQARQTAEYRARADERVRIAEARAVQLAGEVERLRAALEAAPQPRRRVRKT